MPGDAPVTDDYQTFLHRKTQLGGNHGFDPSWMPPFLFDFQADLVAWACRKGRAAIFADCGLGKTPMQLVWAENVARKTGGRVLILAPIAVSLQTKMEGEKFGVDVERVRDGAMARGRIVVTNYQQLHRLNPSDYSGVVCDESSVLKHFDAKTRKDVTRFLLKIPYRLLATATPAPNDWSELGSSSEALGELTHTDMLEMFFRELDWDERRAIFFDGHYSRRISLRALDSMTGRWRLKGHAVIPFWQWVGSWARACRKPSDLGPYRDEGFQLPPLIENDHVVGGIIPEGMLFTMPAISMRQELAERRAGLIMRCDGVVSSVMAHTSPVIIWHQLNDEGDYLAKRIPDAVHVAGKHTDEEKEEYISAFLTGKARVMITKQKIAGLGLNMQHCAHVVTFPSHSYEAYYQAVRRCWRFGQKLPVTVDTFWTEGEVRIKNRLRAKCRRADEMFGAIVEHMHEAQSIHLSGNGHGAVAPEWLCPIQSSLSDTQSTTAIA